MLDWDSFRVILAVARNGSLNGAARSMGVNHATVGRQLRRAEESFGAKLFDRLNSGLFATEAGKSAIVAAERIEHEVTTVNRKIRGADDSEDGIIRFSFPRMVLPFGLSEDVHTFCRLNPGVFFQFSASDEIVDFNDREIDVVLRAEVNPSSGLWGFKIADMQFSFYASKHFLDRWASEIDRCPNTVPIPFIQLRTANPAADSQQIIKHFPNAQPCTDCNGLDSVIPLIRSGFGVGRLARYMARGFPDLVEVCSCDEDFIRPLWILTHPDFRYTPRIRNFMEFIKCRFKARSGEF